MLKFYEPKKRQVHFQFYYGVSSGEWVARQHDDVRDYLSSLIVEHV